MSNVIKKVDDLYYLQIGVQGENMAEQVKMDVSDWMEKYPDGTIYILFKRYNDQYPYPVATTYEDGILTWTPSVADTSVAGIGYAEVRLMDSNHEIVKKSRILPTVVENSVSGTDGAEVPSPFEEWTNQILEAAEGITDAEAYCDAAADRAEAAAASITGHNDVPITIDFGTVTELPWTVAYPGVTANMTVDEAFIGNPKAFTSDITVTTSASTVQLSGTMSGSSTVKIKLSVTT